MLGAAAANPPAPARLGRSAAKGISLGLVVSPRVGGAWKNNLLTMKKNLYQVNYKNVIRDCLIDENEILTCVKYNT